MDGVIKKGSVVSDGKIYEEEGGPGISALACHIYCIQVFASAVTWLRDCWDRRLSCPHGKYLNHPQILKGGSKVLDSS